MIVETGVYRRIHPAFIPLSVARGAMFFDRDGVIVEEVGYLHEPEKVVYLPGAREGILRLNQAGIPVVVVTNQAGIGRGYYGWEAFESVQNRIDADLAALGGRIDAVWACGVYPEHPYRKPNPGMLTAAAGEMGLTLHSSWLVGDKVCDLEAAIRAGLGGAIHVRTGHGAGHRDRVASLPSGACRIETADTVAEAIDLYWKIQPLS